MKLRSTHFPYCLRKLEDGRFIILNRNYKPLGNMSSDFVSYETDQTAFGMKLTPAKAAKISWNASEDMSTIYLYNDGCVPTESATHMSAYLKRLEVLMKLKRLAKE